MVLSRFNLKNIQSPGLVVPGESVFDLPEKVLQFGSGVLLRGLPDYYIDKANRQGIFNGRIVVVKSTEHGDISAFHKQDGLYTLCARDSENGKIREDNVICSAISRVVNANTDWRNVLQCAHNPELQIIISNTTEIGIKLINDNIRCHPPVSFPGKLLAFLYERYKAFDGSQQCGMVILPTELILGNGKKLESIVIELAHLNGLDDKFIDWLENCNQFCNTLVDRIVSGIPAATQKTEFESRFGYRDELLNVCENYKLWAIEGNEKVASVLSFTKSDKTVFVVPNIDIFNELKLRLLNATHTLSCSLSYLYGLDTVRNSMQNPVVSKYMTELMLKDIAPAIPYQIKREDIDAFAQIVLKRFSNPLIDHNWLKISLNNTYKIQMRVLPVVNQYYKLYQTIPERIVIGFAAYLLFMKPVIKDGNKYYGERSGTPYLIRDGKASYFYKIWKETKPSVLAAKVLHDNSLWGDVDLSVLEGFAASVQEKLNDMLIDGISPVVEAVVEGKKAVA